MIKLENVNKYFGDMHVLKDVNLEVAEGEKLVIIGPSGSGKSTTVRCMNFLEEPTSGHVYIDGRELTAKNKTKLVRETTSIWHYLVLSLFIIPVIYTATLRYKNAAYFSCVVFLSIVVNHIGDVNPYFFVFHRTLDTLIGIALGIIVNFINIPGHRGVVKS